MHGNSSARVEAIPQLSLALSLGATLVAFDFAGSGLSGGEYVSLGYYERDDVKVRWRSRDEDWSRELCGFFSAGLGVLWLRIKRKSIAV